MERNMEENKDRFHQRTEQYLFQHGKKIYKFYIIALNDVEIAVPVARVKNSTSDTQTIQ